MSVPAPLEPAVTPPVVQPVETEGVRQLREQNKILLEEKKASDARASAAEALITEAERAKLADNDRLKAELDDEKKRVIELSGSKATLEAVEAKLQARFELEMSKLPDDQKAKAIKLTGYGVSISDKYDILQDILPDLMPSAPEPLKGGSITNPGSVGSVPVHSAPPVQMPPTDWGTIPFHSTALEVAADPQRMLAIQQNLPRTPSE